MTNKPQIDELSCAVKTLADAANALERAEFIDATPELQPPNLGWYFVKDTDCESVDSDPVYEVRIHPTVSAYRAALRALPHIGPDLTKNLHKQRRELQLLFNSCKAEWRARHDGRVNNTFQGGLRRWIDTDFRYDLALADLRAIEVEIAKVNRAKRKAKWKERMRPEFVTIGGEVYQVSK
jgi:hypothetical protein